MNRHDAFTLIEILIVVLLVSIMAGVIVPIVGDHTEEAQQCVDDTNLQILQNQVEVFRACRGVYPSSLSDLVNADPPFLKSIPGGESAWSYVADTGTVSAKKEDSGGSSSKNPRESPLKNPFRKSPFNRSRGTIVRR